MVSIRDNTGMVSGVHFGMDLGHDTGMDLAKILGMIHGLDSRQSCMDLGGIVRGEFWHGFDVNFEVNFEKEIAYLFRHPRVRAHV